MITLACDAQYKCVLLLVSTEWDKDFPDVEVTESAPAGVVATYVI